MFYFHFKTQHMLCCFLPAFTTHAFVWSAKYKKKEKNTDTNYKRREILIRSKTGTTVLLLVFLLKVVLIFKSPFLLFSLVLTIKLPFMTGMHTLLNWIMYYADGLCSIVLNNPHNGVFMFLFVRITGCFFEHLMNMCIRWWPVDYCMDN